MDDTIRFRHEGASLKIDRVPPSKNTYTIRNFWSQRKRQGHGQAVLKLTTDFADEHGLTLLLVAQRYGRGGMTDEQLRDFYHRNGFRQLTGTKGGLIHMIRYPVAANT